MKWMRPPRLEWYTFLFSMPLIDLAVNQVLYKDRLWHEPEIWLFSFPLIFGIGFISWYGHVLYSWYAEKKYPGLHQSAARITRKALIVLFVMTPSILVIFFVYDYFGILGYSIQPGDMWMGMAIGVSVNLIFETLYESDYMLSQYKKSQEEKKALQEYSALQEFETLKNQVNPHFLFNCFNTLSSLITQDKQKAEAFLNELSKVYRYLLRNNQEGVSTVQSELKFIESYYRLLKTRHGDAVELHMDIDKRYEPYLLPSLSLQLLVENVVKHNVLSKNKPLVIDIFTTAGNKLVVNNNLQRRTARIPSGKVGLENIRSKYELLGQKGFQVMEDKSNFTVVLPLIWHGGTGQGLLQETESLHQ